MGTNNKTKEILMSDQKKSLEQRLKAHPDLQKRIETILDIVEDASDDVKTADEAEQRAIEELRQLGSEVMKNWAAQKEGQKAASYQKNPEAKGHGKKKFVGTRHLAK
jgi:hypothetical protein